MRKKTIQWCLAGLCLLSGILIEAETFIDVNLAECSPFVRRNRGWEQVHSSGEWPGYKWVWGAWDASCLIEFKLEQDPQNGEKYISLANLEGQPSMMFFRPEAATVAEGEAWKLSFEYRTTGSGRGEAALKGGSGNTQEVKVQLHPQSRWTPVSLIFVAEKAGSLTVEWRPLTLGAQNALHLRKAVLSPTNVRSASVKQPDLTRVTGAHIDESQVAVTLHVNGTARSASDDHAGTDAAAPLKTITAAINKSLGFLQNGQGVRIVIQPGTYRERAGRIDFGEAGREPLLVIEGAAPGQVIISGSDIFADWEDLGGGLFRHKWEHAWGHSYHDWPAEQIGHRCEMVFIDGKPLRQKILETWQREGNRYTVYTGLLSPEKTLQPGEFGVTEHPDNGAFIIIRLPEGKTPAGAAVEVAVRHTFAEFSAKSNLVLRNLTVQHFANRRMFPWTAEKPFALDSHTRNLLVENCAFMWNNSMGFSVGAWEPHFKDATIRRSRFSYNGFGGLGVDRIENLLIEDCVTDMNGWRGFWCGDTGWAHGGIKFHNTESSILRRHQAAGNICAGIWYDIHCHNVLVEELTSILNAGPGLFTEISAGPFLIRKSLLAHNQHHDYMYYSVGNLTMENTILASVNSFKEKDQGIARFRWYPRPGNDHWEQKPFEPEWLVMRGIVTWSGNSTRLWNFSNNPSLSPAFRDIYRGENNLWWAPEDRRDGFVFGDWDDNTSGNFADWKNWMGDREQNPRWADPGFNAPELLDFSLKKDSILIPRSHELAVKKIPRELLTQIAEFFAWAGFNEPLEKGALTPPVEIPVR